MCQRFCLLFSARRMLVISIGLCFLASDASGQQLTPKQRKLLETLDLQAANQALSIADKAVQWRQRLQAANQPEDRVRVAIEIAEEAEALQSQFPQLAAPVNYDGTLAPILQRAEQTWQQAEYIAEEYIGFTEDNFREEAKRRAMGMASEELKAVMESQGKI